MFPPTDPRWRDADSLDLLKRAYLRVVEAGLSFVSADITGIIEEPQLARYPDDMRGNPSGAPVGGVSTGSGPAETKQGIGWVGKGEGGAVAGGCSRPRCSRISRCSTSATGPTASSFPASFPYGAPWSHRSRASRDCPRLAP